MRNELDLKAMGASIVLPKMERATQLPFNLPIIEFNPQTEDVNSVISLKKKL